MTKPDGAEAPAFVPPFPQQETPLDQVTHPSEGTPWDQPAAGSVPAEYQTLDFAGDNGANQDSDDVRRRPETPPAKPDIPPHLLEAAGRAIDSSLAVSSGRMISFGKILHLAFGDELLSPNEFTSFKRAINEDPRTRYKGKGRYLI